MPTHVGDVVVSYSDSGSFRYAAWRVVADAQQAPSASAYVSTAHGAAAALRLARRMLGQIRSVVFVLELDSLTWTKHSPLTPSP